MPTALEQARAAIESGEHILGLDAAGGGASDKLVAAGFGPIDYLAYVDGDTLEPLDHASGDMRLIAAAILGRTRLIDNLRVDYRHSWNERSPPR